MLDMAAVVHMVWPSSGKTFVEYVTQHLVPFLNSQISPTVTRLNAIWDTCPKESLKSLAHLRLGTGPRYRVGDSSTKIPKLDWNSGFLKNEENKKELFLFLSKELIKQDLGGVLLPSTKLQSVIANREVDLFTLTPCNHCEADTRI